MTIKVLELFAGTRSISQAFERRGGKPTRSNGIGHSRTSRSATMSGILQKNASWSFAEAYLMSSGRHPTARHTASLPYRTIADRTATRSNQSALMRNSVTKQTAMSSSSSDSSARNCSSSKTLAADFARWTSCAAFRDIPSLTVNTESAE